jgi:hypothetical protein
MSGMPSNAINHYLLAGDQTQKLIAAMIKDDQARHSAPPVQAAPTGTVVDKLAGINTLPQGMPPAAPPPQQMPPPQMPPQGMPQQAPIQAAGGGAIAFEQGGVASLPSTDDMYGENSFAGGGIIGYEEGGEVVHAADGLAVGYPKYTGGMGHNAPIGTPDISGQIETALQGAVRATLAKDKAGLPLTSDERALLKSRGFIGTELGVVADKPQLLPGTEVTPAEPKLQKPFSALPPQTTAKTAVDTSVRQDPAVKAPASEPRAPSVPRGLADRYGIDQLKSEDFLPEKATMDKVRSDRLEAYTKEGVSADPYAAGITQLDTKKKDLDKDEKWAQIEGLASFGFGMMGGRKGQEFDTMAASGQKALAGYSAAKDKMSAKADKLDDRLQDLILAQNNYKKSGADADLKEVKDSAKAYDVGRKDLAIANSNLQAKNAEMQLNTALKTLEINSSNFNAGELRKIQMITATRPDAVSTLSEYLKSSPEFQAADGTKKAAMFSSLIHPPTGTGTHDTVLKTAAGKETSNSLAMNSTYLKLRNSKNPADNQAADKIYADTYNKIYGVYSGQQGAPQAAPKADLAGWGDLSIH